MRRTPATWVRRAVTRPVPDRWAAGTVDVAGYRGPVSDTSGLEVRDAAGRSRFELIDDGTVVAFAEYRAEGTDRVVMAHTVVDPQRRGEGLGDMLVGAAVAELEARGLEIVPTCWFVADHLTRRTGAT